MQIDAQRAPSQASYSSTDFALHTPSHLWMHMLHFLPHVISDGLTRNARFLFPLKPGLLKLASKPDLTDGQSCLPSPELMKEN